MTDKHGLRGIWEDIGHYLKVDIDLNQAQSPDTNYPAILHFLITNTAIAHENQREIVFEEVRLKVGIPPNWHVEKAENFTGGQSFSYDHPCIYNEITRIQWTVEGRVSPETLLEYKRRPSRIIRNGQLSINAYFDYLIDMNIRQWLEGTLKPLTAPGPKATLTEMMAREDSLKSIISEIRNAAQQIEDFLRFVDYEKHHDDIINHKNLIQEYLKRTEQGIADLIKRLGAHKGDGFDKTRRGIVTKLTKRADELDKATKALARKLGVPQNSYN